VLHDRRHSTRLTAAAAHVSLARVARLVRLGLPAALQLTIEVGVFATATALAGRLTPIALAAHQIAMNVIAFLFMVPLGMARPARCSSDSTSAPARRLAQLARAGPPS
jgi:MATE family multidrug resistance protein